MKLETIDTFPALGLEFYCKTTNELDDAVDVEIWNEIQNDMHDLLSTSYLLNED